jgi:hypothetical protein
MKRKYKLLTLEETVQALAQILDSGKTTDKFEHLLFSAQHHLMTQLVKSWPNSRTNSRTNRKKQ